FAVNTVNNNSMFFGTFYGLQKSIDGGESFEFCESGLDNTFITSMEVNPYYPGMIYASGKYGTWRSGNFGEDWERLAHDRTNYLLAVDPSRPDTFFTSCDLWHIPYYEALKRTFNGGDTWDCLLEDVEGAIVTLKILPTDPITLICGISLYSGGQLRLRSEDYGTTWMDINGVAFRNNSSTKFVLESPNIIYACWRALYRSVDYGRNFEVWNEEVGVINNLEVSNSGQELCILRTSDMQVSTDSGLTFYSIIDSLPRGSVKDIAMSPVDYRTVLISLGDSIIYTRDCGVNWYRLYGPFGRFARSIEFSADGENLYVSTFGKGVYCFRNQELFAEESRNTPEDFHLSGDTYPNPFNYEVRIKVSGIDIGDNLKIRVYNIIGELVNEVYNSNPLEKSLQINWDGRDSNKNVLANGVYFLTLSDQRQNVVKKVVKIK
ncbi:T9SS type A sorting domain-containing protein, partial [Calditrichota bacterium]